VSLGVALGLIIGKQVGILLFSWLAVRSRLAVLPHTVTWRQIYGAGWLGGIGFTMSLFIAGLAFVDASLLSAAKVGILTASTIAGIIGWLLLRHTRQPRASAAAADSE
jgi:NhaA family Na+:H+ antiporter